VLAITTIPTVVLEVVPGSVFTALAGTGTGANAGTIEVDSGGEFVVGGTVRNTGIISLVGSGYPILEFGRDTILEGGGQINLSAVLGQSEIEGVSGSTLTNVDNVISGAGIISVALVNEKNGVVDSNGLFLQVGGGGRIGSGPVTNAGLLESTGGSQLDLKGQITNTASGVIGAFGAGSSVLLDGLQGPGGGPASVSGGTLETGSGGGQIFVYGDVTLDGSNGHPVTNTGSLSAYPNPNVDSNLTLLGTINNTGTIALNLSSVQTITVGTGGVTLAGSGSVTLPDTTANEIIGAGTSTTLTNQNTISGAGTIGGDGLLLNNQGVIHANGTNPLIVDTGASAVTNSGTLEATNNSTLFVASNVNNTGQLIANNGTDIFAGAVSGNGTATVQGAGSIEFGSTTTSNVTFGAGGGTVTFDAASTLTGKVSITGFALGDTIDLADIKYGTSAPSLTFSKGVLTVSDGTDTAKLKMVGNYTLANFNVAQDGSGGTLLTDPPVGGGSAPTTSPPGLDQVVALFTQSAAGFSDQSQQGVLNTNPLSQIVTNQEQFLANPHHG
jgi:hypothetical protein